MHSIRLPLWVHPLLFGRRTVVREQPRRSSPLSADLKVFACTYLAGFIFTTMWLA